VDQLNTLIELKLIHYNFDTNLVISGPSLDPEYYINPKSIPIPKKEDGIHDRYSSEEIAQNELYTKRYFNYIQMFLKSQGPKLTGEELYSKLKKFIIPAANFKLNREEFENFLIYLTLLNPKKLIIEGGHLFQLAQ
jgi:hypothetical protein